jgi:hypothetical protein
MDINPDSNWNIITVPAIAADDNAGIKAGNSINELLLSTIPSKSKIATLIHAYGFKQAEAEAMCP